MSSACVDQQKKPSMRLHEYQIEASRFLIDKMKNPEMRSAGLLLDCGLGKTAVTLHTIKNLKLFYKFKKVLVVAPKRVCSTEVWPTEIDKWGLKLTTLTLDSNVRKRKSPFEGDPDICIISCDSLEWLSKQRISFDLIVVDEATKFKNWTAKRTKLLRRLLISIRHRVTLTGTPVPNSLGDFFSQQFILDSGKSLGTTLTSFRARYMQPCGFEMREWEIQPSKVQDLKDKLAPWYLHQAAVDHLDMPDLIRNVIRVELPPAARKTYTQMHRDMVAEIEGKQLAALHPGGRYGQCRQIASGAVYDPTGEVVDVHSAKLEAISELIEELNGKPLVVAYCFKHEASRLQAKFPKMQFINGSTSDASSRKVLNDFKSGRLKHLAVQCQSLSHGVDGLQTVCNDLCWMTLTDQPEIRHQLEARIYRQGSSGKVRIHYLLVDRSVDGVIYRTLERKDATQADLLKALKEG